ncbi:DUF547 domain-containing protein [Flavobacterium sp.]|uniref:DUF547 domain-containing protein n=1 Tax=Flavobacterium sp. TaxID=239 RepID=UPI003C4D4ECE
MKKKLSNFKLFKTKITIMFSFLVFSISGYSQTVEIFFEQTNEFLKKNVTAEGKIDYITLKKSPGELMYILSNVEKLDATFTDKNLAKAFWINIYNLQVIKGVLDTYPFKNVNQIPNFFKGNYFIVIQQELTLDDVENTILRELLFDPAIHFALSSASNGGAPLLNEAYMPKTIEEQLKTQASRVINSKSYYKINKDEKSIALPKIFEWYKKDFVTQYFNEIDFLNIFSEKRIDNKLSVTTYDFDWTLNQK